MQNHKATHEHISKVLDDQDESYRLKELAIKNPKSTVDHISKVLGDSKAHWSIKAVAQAVYNERFKK